MTAIEILSEIHTHQIKGVMLHDEIATVYDFMALRGYKRMHEYQALQEFVNARSTSRYAVNHLNQMLIDGNPTIAKITPSGWKSATRFDVNENDRKTWVKEYFKKWRAWEQETKAFYQTKFKDLMALGAVSCANKVNELIKDVDCELKKLEREYLAIASAGFDMLFIAERQNEIHDKYEAMEKEIGVNFN